MDQFLSNPNFFHVFIFILPESEYSVQAYGIHADFMLGRHVYQEIYDALQELEIGILGEQAPLQQDVHFICGGRSNLASPYVRL